MTLISVVISAHNASPWIAETLNSVLAQTIRDVELIVVDDGSTDNTRKIVAGYESLVRLIAIERLNKSAGKNMGIRAARGDFIAFVDADDVWMPDKLELQLGCFHDRPDLRWVYTDGYLFDDSTGKIVDRFGRLARLHSGDILRPLLLANFIPSCAPMIRRNIFERVGYFDENLLQHQPEDWDLWLRIAAHYPVGLVDRPLALCRLHADSLTAREDLKIALAGQIYIVECAIARDEKRLNGSRNRALANLYIGTGRIMARSGNLIEARRMFAQAVRLVPYEVRYSGYWLMTFAGTSGMEKLITMRRLLQGRSRVR